MIFQHCKMVLKVAVYSFHTIILGTPAELSNVTINFVKCVVYQHRPIRFPLDGFSLNLIFEVFFEKPVEKIQVLLKYDKHNRYFT